MKPLYWLLAGILLLSGCKKNQANNVSASNDNLLLTISAKVGLDGKVVVTGETNLPNDTGLLVEVERGKYLGEDKPNVMNGHYKTTAFSDHGNAFSKGTYTATVIMPIPQVQPDSVKALIGSRGENLHGDLLHRDDLGISAEVKTTFSIP